MSRKLLVGYWHNFINNAGSVPLPLIPEAYDIVNIAFAVPIPGSLSFIGLEIPPASTVQGFAADVRSLQEKGKRVLLSIGGGEATVQLHNAQDLLNFITSVSTLVKTYGFDGIDIDFENHSLYLDRGDVDPFRPTTPVIVNIISALQTLHSRFGPSFMLTMAPETFFVQQGLISYGGDSFQPDNRAGCALPVINGIRDILSYLWVQQYNSGQMTALDGNTYRVGERDFHVALSEMVLKGFAVAGTHSHHFPPLPSSQIMLGIPSSNDAGLGFLGLTEITQVITYLVRGAGFEGRYRLLDQKAYSQLAGVMVWSINWDVYDGCRMSTGLRYCLDLLEAPLRQPA